MNAYTNLEKVVSQLEDVFYKIEGKHEPPEFIKSKEYPRFRHKNQTRETAIILKAARIISSLHACLRLLKHGYVQEIGVLSRTIDEFCQEIVFLLDGMKDGELTEKQQRFLDDFYQEEFDIPTSPFNSTQKRDRLPMKNIQAVIGKMLGAGANPSDVQELCRTIYTGFSGYVHGAYPHIMETYGGNPPRYHLNGMLGTPRMEEWLGHMTQYVHRGLLHMILIAQGFGLKDELLIMLELRDEFERTFGLTVKDPKTVLSNLKEG